MKFGSDQQDIYGIFVVILTKTRTYLSLGLNVDLFLNFEKKY